MQMKGIDVSMWQGKIDWSKLKDQIDFAILRAGFGRESFQKDSQFENNYKGCKDNDIPFGVYWYCYATTVEDAKREAKTCIEILKDKKFNMPVWYDIEEDDTFATGKENTSNIAAAFCEALKEAGYKVGIYSFYSALMTYFTDEVKETYDLWLANVGPNGEDLSETSFKGHVMWQYSWKGKFAGITGDVDKNYCYKDYSAAEVKTEKKNASPVVAAAKKKKEAEPAKTKANKVTDEKIDVIYSAYIGQWLGTITNYNETDYNGFAGIKNRGISGIAAKATKGTIRYRVHTVNGGWLGWMTDFNQANWVTGVAGIAGRNIDGFQAELVGVPGYQVEYRVSTYRTKGYLAWIRGYGLGPYGYAGIYGQVIDGIQMRIVKI